MLRVSKVPPGDPTTEQHIDQNRFECLTCPYQYIIKHRYFERKTLQLKKVDDVIGGEDSWKNVDKVKSMSTYPVP
jgi:DNA-directed RNA polymerase III subunit RPC11